MNNQKSKTERKLLEIENYIKYGTEIKWLKKSIVPTEDILEHIQELKSISEKELEESQHIKSISNDIIEDAKNEANKIMQKVREEIEEQDLVQQAQRHANQIIFDAQKEADTMVMGARKLKHEYMVEGYRFIDSLLKEAENRIQLATSQLVENNEGLTESRKKLREKIEAELKNIQQFEEKYPNETA